MLLSELHKNVILLLSKKGRMDVGWATAAQDLLQ